MPSLLSRFHSAPRTLKIAVLFFVVGICLYGPSVIHNDFVSLDDNYLIYENADTLRISADSFIKIFTTRDPELYIPVTFLSYQLDYLIGDIAPFTYHATNLLLHILNALLVFVLLALLTRRRIAPIIAGLLFLVHPINSEAVLWASARKDLLSSFFLLLSLVAYTRSVYHQEKGRYLSSIILFLLALLSKPTVLIASVLLILIDFLQHRPLTRKAVTDKLPFFVLAIVFGLIGLQSKTGGLGGLSIFQVALLAAKSTVFYLTQILEPRSFSVIYLQLTPVTITASEFLLPALIALILLGVVLRYTWRWPLLFFGVFFFLVAIAPSFVSFYRNEFYFASDRYVYVGSIGIFLLLGLLVEFGWSAVDTTRRFRQIYIALLTCLLFSIGLVSIGQSAIWRNGGTLMTHAIKLYPSSLIAHLNRAGWYRAHGHIAEAIRDYDTAITLRPDAGLIHIYLGDTHVQAGNIAAAKAEYALARATEPENFQIGLIVEDRLAELQKK